MSALDRLTRHQNEGLVLDAEEVREVLACIAGLKAQRHALLEALFTIAGGVFFSAKELRRLAHAAIANATGA